MNTPRVELSEEYCDVCRSGEQTICFTTPENNQKPPLFFDVCQCCLWEALDLFGERTNEDS